MSAFRSQYFLIVIFLIFTGCTKDENSTDILRLGNTVWPGYEPFYLAKEKKMISVHKVRLVEYTSTSQVLNAYRHGLIDAAAVTLYDALMLLSEGLSPQIVLILDVSYGGDVIISQKDLPHFKDLVGKNIGLEKSAMGIQVLARSLEINKIAIEDVNIKIYEGYEHEQAFIQKDIDAIVTYEPIRSKLLQKGANEVFTSKQMPNEIIDVLIVRKSYLDTHIKQVAQLTDKWYQALAYYKEHPEESNRIFSKRLNLKPEEVKGAFAGLTIPTKKENLDFFEPGPPSLIQISKEIERLMRDHNYLKNSIDVKRLIDYDRSVFTDQKMK